MTTRPEQLPLPCVHRWRIGEACPEGCPVEGRHQHGRCLFCGGARTFEPPEHYDPFHLPAEALPTFVAGSRIA